MSARAPKYRLHKPTRQVVVTLSSKGLPRGAAGFVLVTVLVPWTRG